ncbi:MAG: hypothetical protein J6Y94_05415, partial [Bacteriovoracaceae bacterium]|nr:hypothetical protein [Bacteriovoracaceae bacterium]
WRNPYLLKSFPFLDSYNHKDKFLQILHQFWQASDKKQREIADTYFWRSTGNMPIFRQITVLNSFMKRNAVNALFHDDIFDYFHRKTAPGQKFVRYPAPYEISGFYKIGELAPFRESLVKLEQELRKKYRREAKLTRQDLQKLPGDLAEQYQKMADFVATCPLDYFNRLYLHFPHVGLFYLEEQMAIQRQIFQQETIPTFYDGQEIIFSGRDVEKIVFASPKKFTVYFRQNQNAPDRIHPVPARTIEVTLAHRLSELMQVKHWPFEQPLQRGESARFPRGGNSPALLQPSWPMKFPQYVSLNTTGGGTALAYPHLKYAEIDFRWLTPEQRAEFKDFLTSSDREGKVLLANTITYQMANVLKIDNEMLQLYLDPHLLHFFVSFIRERKSMRYAPVTYLQRMAERVATEDQLLQDMQTRQQEQVAKKAQEERERQKRKFDKVVDRLANDLAQEIGEQLSHDEAVEEAREAGENSRHKILQELEARLIVHNVLQTEEVLQEHAPEHQYPLTLQDIDPAWLQSAQQVIAERINQTVQKVIDKAHRSNVEKLASKFKYDLDQQVLRKIIAQLGVVPHLIDPTWVTFPLTVREDLLDLRTEDFRQHYPPDKALLSSPEMQAILIAAIDLVRPLPQNPPLVQDAGSDAQDPVANIYRFLVLQRLQMYPEYNTNRQLAVAFEDYLQNLSNDPAQKIYKFWMDLILCDAPQTDNQLLVAQLEELTLDDVRFTGWLEELEYLRLMMRYEPPFKDDGYLSAQQRRKIYQHY